MSHLEHLLLHEPKKVEYQYTCNLNWSPSMTVSVKLSQNVDILDKVHVYLVHLKGEHCQTLRLNRSKLIDRFWLVKTLSCIFDSCQMTVKTSQKCPCGVVQQSKMVIWLIDHCSYMPGKFSYSRRILMWHIKRKNIVLVMLENDL